MSDPGRFITIEGIEGVGKTTQVARLSQVLSERGVLHVVTREPGGTPLAEKIRNIVLDNSGGEVLPPNAELLLMFAARAVHLTNHIEPHLRAGSWVVCDRLCLPGRRAPLRVGAYWAVGSHGARCAPP
jgi:dTMP kinase